MKKLLLGAGILLAIAGFGTITLEAHAASVALNDQAAALQQSIDTMKAKVIGLEMQQGMVPAGDAGVTANASPLTVSATVTPSLSSADVASINTALNALTVALTDLQSKLGPNGTLSPSDEAVVLASLGGISKTLGTIVATVQGGAATNVAMGTSGSAATTPAMPASPAPVVSVNPAPANTAEGTLAPLASGDQTANAAPAPSTDNKQTAQASSLVASAKAHWPTIAIGALVVVILAILFWPQSEEEEKSGHKASAKSAAPIRPIAMTAPQPVTATPVHHAAPSSNMASMATAPHEHVDVQPAKVTIVRPQEPKKKTA